MSVNTTTYQYNGATVTVRERLGKDTLRAQFIVFNGLQDVSSDNPMDYYVKKSFANLVGQVVKVDGELGFPLPAMGDDKTPLDPDALQASYAAVMETAAHQGFIDAHEHAIGELLPATAETESPKKGKRSESD